MMSADGLLTRSRPETGDNEELPLGCLVAMATGEDGTLAVASIDREMPAIWITRDGEEWHYRLLPELDQVGGWELAIAGDAAAVHMFWRGVWVSRDLHTPFARCEALGDGGPIAFEGGAPDAALLCGAEGRHVPGFRGAPSDPDESAAALVRVDATGAAVRIAEIRTPPGTDIPHIASLAWDASRQALWAALPGLGLFRSEPPSSRHPNRPRAMLS